MISSAESPVATPPRRWLDPPEAPLQPESRVAWPVELLHSADPIQIPIGREQRMFLRLGFAPSHGRLGARAVVLAPCLLLAGAVAAAAFNDWRIRSLDGGQQLAREAGDQHAHGSCGAHLVAPGLPAPPAEHAPVNRPVAAHAAASRPPAAASLEDPSLVLAAVRALRVEHDPQRARALVASYLQQHPTGALAEEARAVEIEAAVDHRDPDATRLAVDYLIQYPDGAFTALAQRTVARRDLRGRPATRSSRSGVGPFR